MKNTGEMPCEFAWKVPEPLQLSPLGGALAIGESVTMTLGFVPTEACVVESTMVCKAGLESYSVRVKASGKYSYIHVNKNEVDFGNVLTGVSKVQTIQITNRSSARTSLAIEHVTKAQILHQQGSPKKRSGANNNNNISFTKEIASLYSFSPKKMSLMPGEVKQVNVTFTPTATGTYSNELYRVITPSDKVNQLSSFNPQSLFISSLSSLFLSRVLFLMCLLTVLR